MNDGVLLARVFCKPCGYLVARVMRRGDELQLLYETRDRYWQIGDGGTLGPAQKYETAAQAASLLDASEIVDPDATEYTMICRKCGAELPLLPDRPEFRDQLYAIGVARIRVGPQQR